MSMNFGRELSLLRVRFTEAGSPEQAAAQKDATGSEASFLGAAADEIRNAADELVATYPDMGRAQMTAFVRTLWQSNIHEMRVVGSRILAARAMLLEPADLPFVEGLLKKCDVDAIAAVLAGEVLGTLTIKNKKVWRDLGRMAKGSDDKLRRAALRACRLPLLGDEDVFARFVEIAEPLFESGDAELLAEVDRVLTAVAARHAEAVQELAARHGRSVQVPKARKKAAATKATETTAATRKAITKPAAVKKATPKKAAAKKTAKKK